MSWSQKNSKSQQSSGLASFAPYLSSFCSSSTQWGGNHGLAPFYHVTGPGEKYGPTFCRLSYLVVIIDGISTINTIDYNYQCYGSQLFRISLIQGHWYDLWWQLNMLNCWYHSIYHNYQYYWSVLSITSTTIVYWYYQSQLLITTLKKFYIIYMTQIFNKLPPNRIDIINHN